MDKLQWFKFSYADWRMGKIQRCPEVTQARFINLCCLYWSKEANLTVEDAEIEIDKEHLDILISKKIIEANEEHIFIKFLDEQLQDITETSKGKSKAAKARWDKYRKDKGLKQDNADAMHVHKDAMQNSAEKRREDKRREENKREEEIENGSSENFPTKKSFLKWFNDIRENETGIPSNFNDMYPQQQTDLFTLKKSYTIEQFTKSLKNLCQDKWAKENNQIIPKHFLNLDNFAKYLNQESKGEKNEYEMLQEHIARKRKEEGMSI